MRGALAGAAGAIVLLLAGCGGRSGPGPADASGEEPAARKSKPEVELSSSAASGFIPLTIVLVGRLSGVAPDDRNFDGAGEKWIDRYYDMESVTEHKPGKGKIQQETGTRLFYERTVTISDEGYHSFRLAVVGIDGRMVYSNWVKVRGLSRD